MIPPKASCSAQREVGPFVGYSMPVADLVGMDLKCCSYSSDIDVASPHPILSSFAVLSDQACEQVITPSGLDRDTFRRMVSAEPVNHIPEHSLVVFSPITA